NVPSLLGSRLLQPYYHNGAAESLTAVVSNATHRTGGGRFPDVLGNPADQAYVVKFLESIDAASSAVLNVKFPPAYSTPLATATVVTNLTTGAEPRNIVCSPDGKRVFVANSGQDTITVINTATRAILGQVDLRHSLANDPDRSRHFQPRGLAVTADSSKLYVT